MLGRDIDQPTGTFAIVNARTVLPHGVRDDLAVLVDGARIVDVVGRDRLAPDVERVDAGRRILTPGLIDIHTHGARGASFNDATDDAFATIVEEQARRGVTGLLATTTTAPIDEILAALARVRAWRHQAHAGATILGAHVEGPYFAPEQSGAQDPRTMRTPDDGSAPSLLAYGDVIRILTFAPELPGAIDLTRELVERGIVAAAGHSDARDVDVERASHSGLSHLIHIWSGQSTTVRDGPWRCPGLLEFSLTDETATVEMIADAKHLPPRLMKLAYRCIGPDRLCLISDATNGAGLPEGTRFRTGSGDEHEVHDGVGMTADRTSFAGSTTLLNEMIPIVRDLVGVHLHEAVRMAAATPARVLGLERSKGRIAAGMDADLALFDNDFTTWRTMIGGRWVFAAS